MPRVPHVCPMRRLVSSRLVMPLVVLAFAASSLAAAERPPARSSDPLVRFERMPIPPGLIYDILQDSQDFMWFAGDAGVFRFDGYEVRRYAPTPDGTGAPSGLVATMLREDPVTRHIWVSTDQGLGIIDPTTGRFFIFRPKAGDPTSIASRNVTAVLVDRSGGVWAGADGLEHLDRATNRFTHFRPNPADPTSISSRTIYRLMQDDRGTIWVGTPEGLHAIDPSTGHARRFDPAPVFPGGGAVTVQTVVQAPDGRMMVATSRGVVWFDRETGRFDAVRDKEGQPVPELQRYTSALVLMPDGTYWVGTTDGLVRYRPDTGRVDRFIGSPTTPDALAGSNIRALYVDKTGALWIAPRGLAVCRYDPGGVAVAHYRRDPIDSTSLGNDNVWAIAEATDGALWLATDGGIDRLDLRGGRTTHFTNVPGDPHSLPVAGARDITIDPSGRVWAGLLTGGVARIDPKTGKVVVFPSARGEGIEGLDGDQIRTVLPDPSGTIWAGSFEGHLHRFEEGKNTFLRLPVTRGVAWHGVLAATWARDGTLWVATNGSGVVRVDAAGHQRLVASSPDDPGSLNGPGIWSILEDRQGVIWVGSSAGLCAIEPKTEKLRCYSEADGLVSSVIRAIVEADDGSLWVSTNRGLSRIATDRQTIRNLTMADGFAVESFNYKAGRRLSDGRLCFGGPDGVIVFDPTHLPVNTRPPRVALTRLLLMDTPVAVGAPGSPLDKELEACNRITLGPSQRSLTIEFAALNYRFVSRNQYRYRLLGFSSTWSPPSAARRAATYTALPPGQYEFQVQGSNNSGVWSNVPRSLIVVVKPPWWRNPWAYAAYVLAGVGLLLGFVHLRTRAHVAEIARQRALNEELERRVRERTAQLEAANRDLESFSYSVSHDLRAPLRAIDGFSTNLLNEYGNDLPQGAQRYLVIVRQSAQKMGQLIDALLSFSRLGRQPLAVRPLPMEGIVRQVVEELRAGAAGRDIEFVLGDLPPCEGDLSLLTQVWTNLVGNAVKFTRQQPKARIEIGSERVDGQVAYFVKDNGAGFDMEYVQKLFGVFQRLHSQSDFEGTGVGLAIVQQIVERHGGRVWAQGEPGQGARFWFTIGSK